jgi:hypothetical protein
MGEDFTDQGINELMRTRQEAAAERDKQDKIVQEASEAIKVALIVRNARKFEGEHYTAQQIDMNKVTLSEQELMEHGVQPDVIAASKVTTVVTQLRVTARKGGAV